MPGSSFNASAVISLKKIGAHEASRIAGTGVVDDGLETVADFSPILTFGWGDEKENAAVVFFAADTELFVEFVAILFGGFAFKGAHCHDGHLGAGFLFELEAETFEAGFAIGVDNAGKIGDVAGGVDVLDVVGGSGESGSKEKKNYQKVRRDGSRVERNAFGGNKRHATTTIGGARKTVKRGGRES